MALSGRSKLFFGLALIDALAFLPTALIRDTTLHGADNPTHVSREPEKIWFAPEGDLYAVFTKGLLLEIERYSEGDRGASWGCKLRDDTLLPDSVTMPRGLGKDDRSRVDLELRARGDKRSIADSILQFAISKDGKQIAWAWEGRLKTASLPELCLGRTNSVESTGIEPVPLVGLQLQGDPDRPSAVAVFEDGAVVVQRPGEVTTSFALAKAFSPSALIRWILPRNPADLTALTAGDSSVIAFVTVARKPAWESLDVGITNPTAVHRLSASDLFVGTGSGVLIHLKGVDTKPEPNIYTVPAMQAIRAIASYSAQDVIVGGDSRSLVWVRKDRTLRTISITPRVVTGLAISNERLAYSYRGGMSLADLTCSVRFSDAGRAKLGWMFSILGVLGFLRAIWADHRKPEIP